MPLDGSFVRQSHLQKARGPVDGDGDGFVYDGTPRKRPATPAERAAGARLRAQRGQGGGQGRPAAKKAAAKRPAKKAPAKNDYDKRFDKFDRAINQAIRAKNPKEIKDLEGWIKSDGILKPNDRNDLVAILQARREGKPDPTPPKGGNREKRGGAAQAAPAPEKAAEAPAKKAPAKRPAKKAPAKPETPKENTDDRLQNAMAAQGLGPRASDERRARDRDVDEYKQRLDQAGSKAARDRVMIQAARELDASAVRALEGHRRENFSDSTEAQEQKSKTPGGNTPEPAQQGGRTASMLRNLRRRLGMPSRDAMSEPPAPGTTDHGARTRAWMRAAKRDIANARDFRTLRGRTTQVRNLLRDGRISEREAQELRNAIKERLDFLGLDQNGNRVNRDADAFRGQTNNARVARDQMIREIKGAGDVGVLERLKIKFAGRGYKGQRDALRANPELLEEVNAAFRKQKQDLVDASDARRARQQQDDERVMQRRAAMGFNSRPGTIDPPDDPGAARQRAIENMPPNWADRFQRVRGMNDPNKRVSALEKIMSDLEKDNALTDDAFNRIADQADEQMQAAEADLQVAIKIKGKFDSPLDPAEREALDKHFAKRSGKIGNAPSQGLFQYIVAHGGDRFDVKRQEDNKGVSGIDVITDKVTGERWFAKHSEFSNDYGKEFLAGAFLNQAGFSKHQVRVSDDGPYRRQGGFRGDRYQGQVMLAQDALQGNGLDGELRRAADMREDEIAKAIEEIEKGLRDGDPQGLINLMLFDYLIDNTQDRHHGNAFFERKGGKMKVQFIDQGLAWGGFGVRLENVTPSAWFAGYRANGRGGWSIAALIGKSTEGRDDVARRVRKAVEDMERNIDFDRLRNQYEAELGFSQDAMERIDQMLAMSRQRLEYLRDQQNMDELVGRVARNGGF